MGQRPADAPFFGPIARAALGAPGDEFVAEGFAAVEVGDPGHGEDGDVGVREALAQGAQGGQGHDGVTNPVGGADQDAGFGQKTSTNRITLGSMTDAQREQLERDGYLVLPDFMSPALLEELRTRVETLFVEEGDQAGSEFKQEPFTKRLANCVDKGEVFLRCIADEEVCAGIEAVIGPEYKLSSVNVRSADPMNEWSQPLHCDMGGLPDERGNWVCNTIWMIDDFTTENGATRCVPGTHKSGKLPQEVLADAGAAHPDEILVTGRAGTVVIMNAHLWHGGTANRTAKPRCAMHGFYCRRDKPQQQYQKRLLRAEVQERLTARERWLLAIDDPLNDAISAEVAVRSGFLK